MTDIFFASWRVHLLGTKRLPPGEDFAMGWANISHHAVPSELRRRKAVGFEPGPDELDLLDLRLRLITTPATPGPGFATVALDRVKVEAAGGALRLLVQLRKQGAVWRADLLAVNGDPAAAHAASPRSQVGAFAHWDT